jgi:hypothetical protein
MKNHPSRWVLALSATICVATLSASAAAALPTLLCSRIISPDDVLNGPGTKGSTGIPALRPLVVTGSAQTWPAMFGLDHVNFQYDFADLTVAERSYVTRDSKNQPVATQSVAIHLVKTNYYSLGAFTLTYYAALNESAKVKSSYFPYTASNPLHVYESGGVETVAPANTNWSIVVRISGVGSDGLTYAGNTAVCKLPLLAPVLQ